MTSLSCYVTRAWENESAMSFGRSVLSREDSFSLADGNFELISFSAYFSSSLLFYFYVLLLRMVFEWLARLKVAFTTFSTAELAKEKCFAEVAGQW